MDRIAYRMAHRWQLPPSSPFQQEAGERMHTIDYEDEIFMTAPRSNTHEFVSPSKQDNGLENRVVLGLDYGTTSTGKLGYPAPSFVQSLSTTKACHTCNRRL